MAFAAVAEGWAAGAGGATQAGKGQGRRSAADRDRKRSKGARAPTYLVDLRRPVLGEAGEDGGDPERSHAAALRVALLRARDEARDVLCSSFVSVR